MQIKRGSFQNKLLLGLLNLFLCMLCGNYITTLNVKIKKKPIFLLNNYPCGLLQNLFHSSNSSPKRRLRCVKPLYYNSKK